MKKYVFGLVLALGGLAFAGDVYVDNGDGTATKQTVIPLASLQKQLEYLKTENASLLRGRQGVLDEIARLTNEDLANYDNALIKNAATQIEIEAAIAVIK